MKHTCSGCGNNLFEIITDKIITDKKHNEVWIVCSKCKRNAEIRIPIDKDVLEQLENLMDKEIGKDTDERLSLFYFTIKQKIEDLKRGLK